MTNGCHCKSRHCHSKCVKVVVMSPCAHGHKCRHAKHHRNHSAETTTSTSSSTCTTNPSVTTTQSSSSCANSSSSSSTSTQLPDVADSGHKMEMFQKPAYIGEMFNISYPYKCVKGEPHMMGVFRALRRSHECDQSAEDHLHNIIRMVDSTTRLLSDFKKSIASRGWNIEILTPQLMSARGNRCYHPAGRVVLWEKLLDNFIKFNSTRGWTLSSHTKANQIVQAFTHFTYVQSHKRLIVLNLQGSIDYENNVVLLSCPYVLSNEEGIFGCFDQGGHKAMKAFLMTHKCSSFCDHFKEEERRHCCHRHHC